MIRKRPDVSSGALAIAGVRTRYVGDGGGARPERGWERVVRNALRLLCRSSEALTCTARIANARRGEEWMWTGTSLR